MDASAPSGANPVTGVNVALRNEDFPVAEAVKEAVGGEFCLAKGLGSGVSGGVMGSLYGLGEALNCTEFKSGGFHIENSRTSGSHTQSLSFKGGSKYGFWGLQLIFLSFQSNIVYTDISLVHGSPDEPDITGWGGCI